MGADADPKSISHEHTYNEDTADVETIESTLMRLSEMVGRRLREHGLYARTIQLKLRYHDFTTITRAHTLADATQLDTEIFTQVRALFRKNWRKGTQVRLLGVQTAQFDCASGPGRSDRRPTAAALAAGFISRGSSARQVWGVECVARHRPEGRFPGAHARKPGGIAGEKGVRIGPYPALSPLERTGPLVTYRFPGTS